MHTAYQCSLIGLRWSHHFGSFAVSLKGRQKYIWRQKYIILSKVYFPFDQTKKKEPSHEIMAFFVLRNLIQPCMRSRPVVLDVRFLVGPFCLLPYFMCVNSEGAGKAAQMRRLAGAFAGRLCDKYQNLMRWLK